MTLRPHPRAVSALAGVVLLATGTAGCAGTTDGKPQIGIDLPRADSDFWKSYAQYLHRDVTVDAVDVLPTTNSQNDLTQLVANTQTFETSGAKAIVMAPQDTVAIGPTLDALFAKNIKVISVDTRPENGEVYMVVRTDNRAYGTKACDFLGRQLGGKGKVAELQGSLSSLNGLERSEAFAYCMKTNYPKITVFPLAADWRGDVASTELQTLLTQQPDLNGIYMQAGGVFLQPTLALLQSQGLLKKVGESGHISIVSNDGIPQELDAIRSGQIDATVSQPADLYAKYALHYAEAAIAGRNFEPGPTDHNSTIIALPNGLEDQLPAPLVTKENVYDSSLWANQLGK